MLRSIKQLYGDSLGTAEGAIGQVRDFYFDDRDWAIRYVVVETGSWLSGRPVLIAPQAFGNFYEDGDRLLVNLARQQIKDAPSIDLHKPVSRQYEEEYFRHFGWPGYWEGWPGGWGGAGRPLAPPAPEVQAEQAVGSTPVVPGDDPHLRSTCAVQGYHLQAAEGAIGRVKDFMVDDRSWKLRYLVVETGHWYAGKEIVIAPCQIDRISYEESKVFVSVSKETIQSRREYHLPHAPYHDSRNFDD